MSGRLINLSLPGVPIPDPIVVDTSVVVAFLQQFFPAQNPRQPGQASAFFRQLLGTRQQALMTPTAYSDLLHLAVRKLYERHLRGQHAALSAHYGIPITNWVDLLKADATILQRYAPNLTLIRHGLVANNVVIAGPETLDFATYPPVLPYREELIDRMVAYGLDTSDALITLEANRLGIDAIVSMDRDLHRALADFDIYTWL